MGHIALRRGRHTAPHGWHLITFAIRERAPLFRDAVAAFAACPAIEDPRLWNDAKLMAWVLMPDHWHGIIASDSEPLSRTVQRLKCNVARRVNLAVGGSGSLWAKAFHDRALRRETDLLPAARYLVMNPVRARLVRRPGDYPFWNAVWI